MTLVKNVFCFIIFYLFYSNSAYAYLDPGGLFSMLGMYIAAIISALIIAKHKLIEIFKKIINKKSKKNSKN